VISEEDRAVHIIGVEWGRRLRRPLRHRPRGRRFCRVRDHRLKRGRCSRNS
jgi:hypothetical protein